MSLIKDEIKGKKFQTPFDYAQGDCQTERSRSLFSLTKRNCFGIYTGISFNSS
jgi:hypothetical protein